jgi:autophagy-related protein 9
MVAPNILSRLVPASTTSPSVYEELREYDESSDASDVEDRAGMALDEENLGQRFEEYELDNPEVLAVAESATESTHFLPADKGKQKGSSARHVTTSPLESHGRPAWMRRSSRPVEAEDGDNEVPASLLIEDRGHTKMSTDETTIRRAGNAAETSVPGSYTTRAQWQAVQAQQRLHQDDLHTHAPKLKRKGAAISDPKERAMWRWANVSNLDNFVRDVYDYYLGNGIWCILLSRAMNLL